MKEVGVCDLKVITIFTYAVNVEDADASGLIEKPDFKAGFGRYSVRDATVIYGTPPINTLNQAQSTRP